MATGVAKQLGLRGNELVSVAVAAAVVLFVPMLPENILAVFDLFVVRILVVLGLLWAVTQSPVVGVLGLLVVGVLYLERNRRKVAMAASRFVQMTSQMEAKEENATVEEEGVPQKTVFVREFDVPEDRTMYYMPKTSCVADSNEFMPPPAGESLNTKIALPSIPVGAQSAGLYQQAGFGRKANIVL